MFRSMNEPQTLPDDKVSEGGYKLFRMCLLYSFMMSRHWTAQNSGAAYQIALVKGMMEEFGMDKKGPVESERKKLVAALKVLNDDHIGSVWTILYELGMTPCTNYIIIFGMLLEVIAGIDLMVPEMISKSQGCMWKSQGIPHYGCIENGDLIVLKCAPDMLGGCKTGFGALSVVQNMPPLAFAKPAFVALKKLIDFLKKPVAKFRSAFDSFYTFKFACSDPLDVIWIHAGDVIGILEILFMIPIQPIQDIFEALVKGLKLVPVMNVINKAIGFIIKLVFENPIAKTIIKGPLKVCEMILSAFVNNPVAKGMVSLFKGFMALLDKPIKFALMGKRFCFTILGLLKKVESMFKAILDKVLGMLKAILKPIFQLVDKGFKKIASLVKLPKFNMMSGLFGQAGNLWEMLKSTGAFDNPFKTYATCAWNLPWVQESGQNLCNCCMVGYAVSNRISYGWVYNEIKKKAKFVDWQMQCQKYKIPGPCILTEIAFKRPQLASLFMTSCPKNPITGVNTALGTQMLSAHTCISSKPKMKATLMTALVFIFKGFLCRFQNIGINPKVMMQLSPLPPVELFRRRREGKAGTTPGMDKCKQYLKGRRKSRRRKSKKTDKDKGTELQESKNDKSKEKEGAEGSDRDSATAASRKGKK